MSIGYLRNARLYVGALDLSGLANQVSMPCEVAALDNTPLNTTGWTTAQSGLIGGKLDFSGWREFGTDLSDQVLAAGVGGANAPVSIWTPATVPGGLGYFTRLLQVNYQPTAKVGELQAYKVAGSVVWPAVRGNELASGSKTTTGNGTGYQLGAVGATQYLYANLHVLVFSGITSIAVRIQSAAANTFVGSTDRITFTTNTATGSQWATPVAGAIADTWWRATWTIVGAGSATIAVTMGIQ